MNRARGEAISEGHRHNRSWAREHPGQRDEAWFKREIAPKLDAFSLKEIAKPPACRSQPARAAGPVRGCRIGDIGTPWSRLLQNSAFKAAKEPAILDPYPLIMIKQLLTLLACLLCVFDATGARADDSSSEQLFKRAMRP